LTESLGTQVEENSCNILVANTVGNSSVTRFPSTSTSQVLWSGRIGDFDNSILPAKPNLLNQLVCDFKDSFLSVN
jgi:hypothetical protein